MEHPPFSVERSSDAVNIRVLTLNLWARHEPWTDRRRVLIDGLRALQPDLVTFQERIKTDDADQAADLLGPDYQIVDQTVGLIGDGNVIAIASRWPIGEVYEVDLRLTPRTTGFPCGTLIAEIAAPEPFGPLLLVNHFPNYQLNMAYEREIQTVAAARFIENLVAERERHVILAGDLDADPDAASIRFLAGRQALDGMSVCYRDAWESTHPTEPGHTFTPTNRLMNAPDWPFRRIDYIFVRYGQSGGSPTLAVSACALAFAQPVDGVWGSDHLGVVADLTVPPPQAML